MIIFLNVLSLEIAVGAPWGGEDKNGIVYLYYGTKNKNNPLVLKQVKIYFLSFFFSFFFFFLCEIDDCISVLVT